MYSKIKTCLILQKNEKFSLLCYNEIIIIIV